MNLNFETVWNDIHTRIRGILTLNSNGIASASFLYLLAVPNPYLPQIIPGHHLGTQQGMLI